MSSGHSSWATEPTRLGLVRLFPSGTGLTVAVREVKYSSFSGLGDSWWENIESHWCVRVPSTRLTVSLVDELVESLSSRKRMVQSEAGVGLVGCLVRR